jgi:hypothetical protein
MRKYGLSLLLVLLELGIESVVFMKVVPFGVGHERTDRSH